MLIEKMNERQTDKQMRYIKHSLLRDKAIERLKREMPITYSLFVYETNPEEKRCD